MLYLFTRLVALVMCLCRERARVTGGGNADSYPVVAAIPGRPKMVKSSGKRIAGFQTFRMK